MSQSNPRLRRGAFVVLAPALLLIAVSSSATAQIGFQPPPIFTYGPPTVGIYPYGGFAYARFGLGYGPYGSFMPYGFRYPRTVWGYMPGMFSVGGYGVGYGMLPPNPPSPYYVAPAGPAYLQGVNQNDWLNYNELLIEPNFDPQPYPIAPPSTFRYW